MCGITGWVAFDADLTQHRPTVDAMTATMALRGPDDGGTWVRPHVALGHRRLAIIDLAGGVQPMSVDTPNGAVVLVYSGEAYNFVELRAELVSRGHHFRTASDTEVVLNGYLEWGDALAERLNGMFAFAIWDARVEQLVLIRDRLGVKPLFYYPTPDGVLFGSEPKAILANPLARRAVDLDGLRESMGMTKVPGQAVWKGMFEVQPGTIVSVDREGSRTRRYWKLSPAPHADDQDTTVGHVRELLNDIVRRQLISDVPHCVLLSGGLDSSVITALAAGHLAEEGQQVRTFSVDFVGSTQDFRRDAFRESRDAPFVRAVVDKVDATHRQVELDTGDLNALGLRRAVISARDAPNGFGESDLSLYLLFQRIRQESTVALSGEAADESFGGYKWFHQVDAQPLPVFPWLTQLLDQDEGVAGMQPFRPEVMELLDLENYIMDQYSSARKAVEHLPGTSQAERKKRTMFNVHLTRFLPMLLDRKDRMSMAVGLEVRVPFCDHRLVEYVYNAPWALKSFDGREKSLLRQAATDLLPESVYGRLKSGYPAIQAPAYVAALQEQTRQMLAEADHPVFELADRAWAQKLVDMDPTQVRQRERGLLERVIDMSLWLEIYQPELILS